MGDDEIKVTVVVVGDEAEEVTLAPGATVADALEEYGTSLEEGDVVKVGGEQATLETVLTNGVQITLVPPVNGG